MIAIVSTGAREREALSVLCESKGWPSFGCDSVHAFVRMLRRTPPRTVITRHRLGDGYSDDVITSLAGDDRLQATKVIVLVTASTTSAVEARQLSIGADCVLRDPVRIDVLLEYVGKYFDASRLHRGESNIRAARGVPFAGGLLNVAERRLSNGERVIAISPREVHLIEALVAAEGSVVSYDTLYSEILGQRFRGDTTSMRVLLNKLITSAGKIEISLRDWIEVIPKGGYRYGKLSTAPAGTPSAGGTGATKKRSAAPKSRRD